MEILKSKHFRNGITAMPFDAGVVLQDGTEYLVVQFDIDHTAAFKMIDGKVNFAEAMRGDYFSDTFKSLLEKEKKALGDCSECGYRLETCGGQMIPFCAVDTCKKFDKRKLQEAQERMSAQ